MVSVIINFVIRRIIVNFLKLKFGRVGKEKEFFFLLIIVSIIYYYGIKLLYCWVKYLYCLYLEICVSDLEFKDLGYNLL